MFNYKEIKEIELSEKVRFIYRNHNEDELKDKFITDINKNYKGIYSNKGQKHIVTKNNKIYVFNKNVLEDILTTTPLSNKDIINKLMSSTILICDECLSKIIGVGEKKITEVIYKFLQDAIIIKRNRKNIYIQNKYFDVVLVFDFHNCILEDILDYNSKNIKNKQIKIENDKFKIVDVKSFNREEEFFKNMEHLDSYLYDIEEAKKDIRENFKSYQHIDTKKNTILITTSNYSYTISDYNIVLKVRVNNKIVETSNIVTDKNNLTLIDSNINIGIDEKYLCNIRISEFYGTLIKAKEYINKLGLSVRVVTKFILSNNVNELFAFIASDIIHYGNILYDNYMTGFMIIKTNRFVYIIKDSVILNILDCEYNEIQECTIPFISLRKDIIRKNEILDLDIQDKLRDFITYKDIENLTINIHAKDRYTERISKEDSITLNMAAIKNDIYKYGEVILGTYYLSTKLIKAKNHVYVISNTEIISIWKVNCFMGELSNRYFNEVEKYELEGCEYCG